MKVMTKAHVYLWVNNGKVGEDAVHLSMYSMHGENWVPVNKDKLGQSKAVEIEIDFPNNFDWRGAAIENIDQLIKATMAEHSVKIQGLEEQKQKLLAISYAGPNDGIVLDDDIPF